MKSILLKNKLNWNKKACKILKQWEIEILLYISQTRIVKFALFLQNLTETFHCNSTLNGFLNIKLSHILCRL